MAEAIYYKDESVRITATRARFAHKTYALKNITSVAGIIIRPNRSGPLLVILFGIILLMVAGSTSFVGMSIVAGSVVVLGVLWWITQKNRYAVEICTAGGEFQTLVSRDEARIDAVIKALNQAIEGQG